MTDETTHPPLEEILEKIFGPVGHATPEQAYWPRPTVIQAAHDYTHHRRRRRMNNPDTLNGLTIHQWKSKWEAAKRHAQEVEEAISRRNAENKQLRIEKWEHRDVVDGKTAKEWRDEARGWETDYCIQNRIIESLEKKQKDPVTLVQAAWDAAYPIPDGATIPANARYMYRNKGGAISACETREIPLEPYLQSKTCEYRTLTPTPAPKPEPWEEPRFCHANGNFYKRIRNEYGNYWRRTGSNDTYTREDMAKLNPKPVTIEGDEQ